MKLTVEVDITPDGKYCDGECLAFVCDSEGITKCMLSMMTEQQGDVLPSYDARKNRYKRTKYCKKVAP